MDTDILDQFDTQPREKDTQDTAASALVERRFYVSPTPRELTDVTWQYSRQPIGSEEKRSSHVC